MSYFVALVLCAVGLRSSLHLVRVANGEDPLLWLWIVCSFGNAAGVGLSLGRIIA